jgi:hypothetical protein
MSNSEQGADFLPEIRVGKIRIRRDTLVLGIKNELSSLN